MLNKQERFNRIEYLIDEIECLDTSIEQEAEMIYSYKQELEQLERGQGPESPYWKRHEQDVIE